MPPPRPQRAQGGLAEVATQPIPEFDWKMLADHRASVDRLWDSFEAQHSGATVARAPYQHLSALVPVGYSSSGSSSWKRGVEDEEGAPVSPKRRKLTGADEDGQGEPPLPVNPKKRKLRADEDDDEADEQPARSPKRRMVDRPVDDPPVGRSSRKRSAEEDDDVLPTSTKRRRVV